MSSLAHWFPVQPDDRVALILPDRHVTYGELGETVGSVRGGLAEAGLVVGDRVMLVAGNSETFVVTYLACLSAGLVTVPVNPVVPADELAGEIESCRPKAVVIDAVGAKVWSQLDDAVTTSVEIVVAPLETGVHPFAGNAWIPGVEVDDDHIAVLLFTSGTAGTPRPAILTHGNLASSMDAVNSLGLRLAGHDHVALAVIPLFHVFGLNLVINLGLSIGASFVLEEYQGPQRLAAVVAEHGVTVVSGPPTLWSALLADETIDDAAFASVQFAVSGAAPLNPATSQAVTDRFGIVISEGYGLTETSGIVSSALGLAPVFGSVGQPFPGIELRLLDEAGADVYVGDAGEVFVRGPMVSPGYFNDPEATERTRTEDGWLITGDLAVVDDDGSLAIVDRLKDLIIVSGFNVHPAEIERVLLSHAAIEAAAVVGEADPSMGERPVAHVVLADGATLTEAEVIEHCRTQLARYKAPRRIVFTAAIPTGLGGKVRRSALVEPAD